MTAADPSGAAANPPGPAPDDPDQRGNRRIALETEAAVLRVEKQNDETIAELLADLRSSRSRCDTLEDRAFDLQQQLAGRDREIADLRLQLAGSITTPTAAATRLREADPSLPLPDDLLDDVGDIAPDVAEARPIERLTAFVSAVLASPLSHQWSEGALRAAAASCFVTEFVNGLQEMGAYPDPSSDEAKILASASAEAILVKASLADALKDPRSPWFVQAVEYGLK